MWVGVIGGRSRKGEAKKLKLEHEEAYNKRYEQFFIFLKFERSSTFQTFFRAYTKRYEIWTERLLYVYC